MLPAAARLTHRDDFSSVIRRGRRVGRTLVVMHALVPAPSSATSPADSAACLTRSAERATAKTTANPETSATARVGFVVSKAVGGAVVRHRVTRRLRHVLRDRLDQLPPGTRLVVRALPRSATASSAELAEDVDRALRALLAGTGQ